MSVGLPKTACAPNDPKVRRAYVELSPFHKVKRSGAPR